MREKIKGIVLGIRKHNETTDIVTVYSREYGRLVFLSSVSNSKGGKLRNARLQPLAMIEADIRFKSNSEFQRLGTFSWSEIWKDIYFHPIKQMIVIFLSEFLNRLLSARRKDETRWNYIHDSLLFLDSLKKNVNDFHIVFLSSLLPFMGIQPDLDSFHHGYFFDMRGGIFSEIRPLHNDFLDLQETAFTAFLLKLDFRNMRVLKLKAGQRHIILSQLLKYYEIHYPGTGNLKSLDILHSLFQ